MKRSVAAVAIVSFLLGAVAVEAAKSAFDPKAYYAGKAPKEAVGALLAQAEVLAKKGSWERIGVGRVHYLSGDKANGQRLFDGVLAGKPEPSDLYRIASVYAIAGEWDKAKPLFERAVALDPEDDRSVIEAASWMNLKGDRVRAEELFDKVFAQSPGEMWHYVLAAGSYVGVEPF
jgi:tetratricopeptide (TPR) repeat protein